MTTTTQTGPAGPSAAMTASEGGRTARLIRIGLVLLALCFFSGSLGTYLWFRHLSSSADLKRATGLRIGYTVKGTPPQKPWTRNPNLKWIEVSDPTQVKELLDALQIVRTEVGMYMGLSPTGSVEFRMPDGSVILVNIAGPTHLDRVNWGQVYVEPEFYHKVNEVASKAEGRKIDVMRQDN
jgi:hypothetical protein